ncbi:hypothetical protein CDAR_430431 [Caerostris darwini]|uniref:Uncharacterized protein n=1 Tax=Caerostris darwini TaxID=1538125 RepID=A0AAV4SMU9_9ARAC|nr:hypothetical protein CDAR_430431 [Caerostris darwini]
MFMKGALSFRICRVDVNLTEEGPIVQEDARAAAEDDTVLKRGDRKIIMPSVHSCCNHSAVKREREEKALCCVLCEEWGDATMSL